MAFTQVDVYGRRTNPDDTPAAGRIVFVPTAAMRATAGATETVIAATTTAVLDEDGEFLVSLAATDDPDTIPTGVTYEVTEYLLGQDHRRYWLPIPHSSSTLDLDVAPIFENLPGAITLPTPGAQGVSVTDVEVDDDTGHLIVTLSDSTVHDAGLAKGPPGVKGDKGDTGDDGIDGSGAVHSINGDVGDVVLDAADVGAAAAEHTHPVADLEVSGTANNTTFLRGDGAWATPTADSGVPSDGSVTNAKVAADAAISADKLADGTAGKVMTAAERIKLAGIASGATAYTDEAAQDAVAVAFAAGTHTGITVTYNDGAGSLSLATATAVDANSQTGTTYTLVAGDAGKVVEMSNAAANMVTIPPNSSVAFAVGTLIEVYQGAAGQTTVAAGAGVTLRAPDGAKLTKQYASASLRKRATNEWVLAGSVSTS